VDIKQGKDAQPHDFFERALFMRIPLYFSGNHDVVNNY
jgi:hypothetical protein